MLLIALLRVCCISVEAIPYFAFNHVPSPPGPRFSGKMPQNPCTAIREFEASMMVHFRERIKGSLIQKINQKVVQRGRGFKQEEPPAKKSPGEKTKKGNRGQLLIDATVAPADIKYPTDVELLNQGRKTTEKIIDTLYNSQKVKLDKKPRTHRMIARIEYLRFAKKRRPSQKQRRKAVKKQLQYLKRNLGHIEGLIEKGASLELLSKKQYRNFLVSSEIYRQQQWMWSNNKKSNEFSETAEAVLLSFFVSIFPKYYRFTEEY